MKLNLSAAIAASLLAAIAIAQNPPAPTVDRVGFPTGYQDWPALYVFDRPDVRQVRTIFANPPAFNVKDGEQSNYPYGSILVMQTWNCLRDAAGVCILDEQGRFQKDPAATPTLFVMRKERGFGVEYGPNRTGEWEYVAYRPDGSYQTRPENSFSCAVCHTEAQRNHDYTYRTGLAIHQGSGAVPNIVMTSYRFLPNTLTVKKGTTVTIVNEDAPAHTVTDDFPGGMDSGRMKFGRAITLRFTETGEFNFHCTIHPSMRGKIVVVD
ncbi:MAG: cytochrome P460 family protein [Acidobacteria bacterium]|nr:cytochrome P460 family protein [Acidobacteriota bacterium]